ncbi:class I SAM-dependent methyltransferase [Microcoleus sp. herbarium14]|uniref:O-linked N-acetylglucosamine transferase family protein n=1 Tax=Microcoleus sp. herbarium14 TaxID=3055439 RepID=UPI002FD5F652
MNKISNFQLNSLIPPEIKDDDFYRAIQMIARKEDIKTVLEIGSSSGQGSTEAFVTGLRENPNQPMLFCLEISKPRFAELQNSYKDDRFVKCYNVSSVSLEEFADEEEVIKFYKSNHTNLNYYPLEQVIDWLNLDIEYIKQSGVSGRGIAQIKEQNNIEFFDIVLIDGSEFTGSAELEEVYGAKYIILDDINTFKNFYNFQRMYQDRDYNLINVSNSVRNGFAIFKKKAVQPVSYTTIQSAVEAIEGFMVPGQEEYLFNKVKSLSNDAVIVEIGSYKGRSTVAMSYACTGTNRKIYCIDTWDGNETDFSDRNFFKMWQENVEKNGLSQYVVPLRGYSHQILSQWEELTGGQAIDFIFIDGFHQFLDVLKDYELSLPFVKDGGWIAFNDVVPTWPGSERVWHNIAKHRLLNHEYSSTLACGQKNSTAFSSTSSPELPIHFFTIVLNGEPFIEYHIEVFKQLPYKWHWHIVEGVADLKHDTAWSLGNGGRITDEIHSKGRSNDGTTEYLDELAQLYPENVTVYRKPEGIFWEGKREMVNAPLANIREECLLWQVDVDELWTVEQLCTARSMFINNPEKTAAFYWCWYFVGENLVISTRNCYAQNPAQEWLRTWRFKPGCVWVRHEPPILAEHLPDGELRNVAEFNAFRHEETENLGLVFQHFAYVIPEQLKFKEQYYGYTNALLQWTALQQQTKFPVLLREYLGWVQDGTTVDTADACAVVPIAQKASNGTRWRFSEPDQLQSRNLTTQTESPTILIDGVFFQLYRTGIARVWQSLLEQWAKGDFGKHIIVLDRVGTAPKIPGLRYRNVQHYNYGSTIADREMLQQVCDEEGADLFISTYYTTPLSTPTAFIAYDMIPEVLQANLQEPMWREKHYGIGHACAYISISENTARDLTRFFPEISLESVTIAHCGVDNLFTPASQEEIKSFKNKYGISKPYFISVGGGSDYKNTILFFQAFGKLASKQGFEIVCTGSGILLEGELRIYTAGSVVHKLQLSDEELRLAYSGAVAMVYPSLYEGFGLPVLEAMACGCPVITCPNASIPEVAGAAALYVKDDDIDGLTDALCEVQKNKVRNSLIVAGLGQAKNFSWSKMAQTVSSALINATKLTLKETDEQTPQQLDKRKAIEELLVEMRNKPAYQLPLQYDLACIPPQLLNEYIRLLFELPYLFQDIGEVNMYYQHIQRWVDYIHTNIFQHSESNFWHSVALLFKRYAKLAVYFSNNNLKEIYVKRADIIEFALKIEGHQIDFDLPDRSADRDKIRLGILADNFSTQAEIFATLPVYKHLNRDEFEIILYFLNASGHRFEKCCLGYTDVAVKLPQIFNLQVETIRKWELDILFIANNITAQTNTIAELALHRLAPIQIVGMNSPVTTGMRHIDYYISSKLTELENDTQNHYIENLVKLDVPAQCFDFGTEEQLIKTISFQRETTGIPQNAVVYISGANFFKILPEVEETWIKIIAGVPDAVLVLYPFNPNWAPIYPVTAFKQRLVATLAKYGLDADRLILLDAVPNRADVKERLKVADIYLDSYPYAGMTSLIDPLEIGLPTVVMSGNYARSNMGASLLRELQMPDLIADSEESYIDLAIALGTNPDLRQQKSTCIKQKMQANPAFLDSRSYSDKIGSLFKEIFYKHQVDALRDKLNLREINLIIFPDWSQPEELLLEELAVVIKATAIHPDQSKITLIIDNSNISEENANLILSSVAINLLMEEDLDVSDGPEISLIGQLSEIQWQALRPRLHGRIVLEHENKEAIAQAKAENIPICEINNFKNLEL